MREAQEGSVVRDVGDESAGGWVAVRWKTVAPARRQTFSRYWSWSKALLSPNACSEAVPEIATRLEVGRARTHAAVRSRGLLAVEERSLPIVS